MAKFPAMPLWTDAYLADCGHLDDADTGRYLMMLIHLWRAPSQRFPNDDVWLARKFRRSVDDVQSQIRPLISEFCKTDGNWVWQSRLKREFNFVSAKSKSQSVRAKSRWSKEKALSQRNATTGNAPTPTPTPKKKEPKADALGDKSPTEIIFNQGLSYLIRNGMVEGQARSMLGKWRKDHGEERLLEALRRSRATGASNPLEFIAGCLKQSPDATRWKQESPGEYICREIRQREGRSTEEDEGLWRLDRMNGETSTRPEPLTAADHIMADLRRRAEQ